MDTLDIASILEEDKKTKNFFVSVKGKDRFVESFLRDRQELSLFVFNSQPQSMPGEHWLAVVKDRTNVYFFDSYGRNPSTYPYVESALRRGGYRLHWNNTRLQGLTTNVCGDYCVLFLLLFVRGWGLRKFISRFASIKDTEERDHSVRATILSLYGENALATSRNKTGVGRDYVHVQSAVALVALTNFLTTV